MFAIIDRIGTGACLWALIGVSIGYVVALLGERRHSAVLIPIVAGLAGGLIVGVGLGMSLSGYRLWECNLGACVGSSLFAAASRWVGGTSAA